MDARKMNRLRRVQSLPARGQVGDWVLLDGATWAWLEGEWVELVGTTSAVDTEATYSSEFE